MVNVAKSAYDGMIEHAEAGFPHEVCGVMIGTNGNITHYKECRNLNTERAHDRYELDPVSFKEADEWARDNGMEILGIYHSHPDHPAIPSEHDLAAAHPFFSYTIVSVQNGAIAVTKSYQLKEGLFAEEEVSIAESVSLGQ